VLRIQTWIKGYTVCEGGGAMAKGDELVKFITEQVVTYIETPKEVRKQAKQSSKQHKESWQTRWFGMLPLAIRMLIQQARKSKGTPPQG
jgi:hypothetical protein